MNSDNYNKFLAWFRANKNVKYFLLATPSCPSEIIYLECSNCTFKTPVVQCSKGYFNIGKFIKHLDASPQCSVREHHNDLTVAMDSTDGLHEISRNDVLIARECFVADSPEQFSEIMHHDDIPAVDNEIIVRTQHCMNSMWVPEDEISAEVDTYNYAVIDSEDSLHSTGAFPQMNRISPLIHVGDRMQSLIVEEAVAASMELEQENCDESQRQAIMNSYLSDEESGQPSPYLMISQAEWTEFWEEQRSFTSPENTLLPFAVCENLMELLTPDKTINDIDEEIKKLNLVNLRTAAVWMRGNFGKDCLGNKHNVARRIRKQSAIIVLVSVMQEVEENESGFVSLAMPSKQYIFVPMSAVIDAVNLKYVSDTLKLGEWILFKEQIPTQQLDEMAPSIQNPSTVDSVYSISTPSHKYENVQSILSKRGPMKEGQEVPLDALKPADKLMMDKAFALARLYSICPLSSVLDVYNLYYNAYNDKSQLLKCYIFDDVKSIRYYNHGYPSTQLRLRLLENLQNSFPTIQTEGKVDTFTVILNSHSPQGAEFLNHLLDSSSSNEFIVIVQCRAPQSLGRVIDRDERQLNKITILLLYNAMRALHVYFFCSRMTPKCSFKIFASYLASEFTIALSTFTVDKILQTKREVENTTLGNPLNDEHYAFAELLNPSHTSICILSNNGDTVRRVELPNLITSFSSHQQILFKLLFHLASPGYAAKIPENVILHPIADINHVDGAPIYNKYASTTREQYDLGDVDFPLEENAFSTVMSTAAGNVWGAMKSMFSSFTNDPKKRRKHR